MKDYIHFEMSSNTSLFSNFGGVMPIGRNFGIHPVLLARVASIDPRYHEGTDDDIQLGFDIKNFLSIEHKIIRNIPLVTNPRREVLLINSYSKNSENTDGKQMYENFHINKFVYNYSLSEIEKINSLIHNISEIYYIEDIIKELMLWIKRNISKEFYAQCDEIKKIIKAHVLHKINYWQMENRIEKYINKINYENCEINNKIDEIFKLFLINYEKKLQLKHENENRRK